MYWDGAVRPPGKMWWLVPMGWRCAAVWSGTNSTVLLHLSQPRTSLHIHYCNLAVPLEQKLITGCCKNNGPTAFHRCKNYRMVRAWIESINKRLRRSSCSDVIAWPCSFDLMEDFMGLHPMVSASNISTFCFPLVWTLLFCLVNCRKHRAMLGRRERFRSPFCIT